MEELSHVQYIALLGFALAFVFGIVANKTHFCTMGAISDLVNMGSRGRLGAWFVAIGISVLGVQTLYVSGYVDITESIYLSSTYRFVSYILGGFLFGVGMTLAAGCGQRNLVRAGAGNLKALVVLLIMGITAFMTMRGILALIRLNWIEPLSVDLAALDMPDQGLVTGVAALTGIDSGSAGYGVLHLVVALAVGLGFIIYSFKHSEFRTSFDNVLAGVVIGACVVGAWYVTGYLGNDDFDPITPASMSFIAPVGNTISYLMTYTGAEINFGIAIALGMLAGSMAYAVISGNFRIETFSNREEMVTHMVGAALMGFGGVHALGCTVGQGITGMSTLSMGSILALFSIFVGCVLTMKVQYYLYDEKSFVQAVFAALADMVTFGRRQEA